MSTQTKKSIATKNVTTKNTEKELSAKDALTLLNASIGVNAKGIRTASVYSCYVQNSLLEKYEANEILTTKQKSKSRNIFRNQMDKHFAVFAPAIKSFVATKKIEKESVELAKAWIKGFYQEYFINNSFTVQSIADNSERQNQFAEFMQFMKFVNENH